MLTSLAYSIRNAFIVSSPRWWITFTAMRPDLGFSNAQEVSLWSVAHACGLISALEDGLVEEAVVQGRGSIYSVR
jgi:hypothetical protein